MFTHFGFGTSTLNTVPEMAPVSIVESDMLCLYVRHIFCFSGVRVLSLKWLDFDAKSKVDVIMTNHAVDTSVCCLRILSPLIFHKYLLNKNL